MKKSVTERDPEASRERILNAAIAEFAANGIGGARMDRIATASGRNKNLIYFYFGNKEELYQAVLLDQIRRFNASIPFTPGDLSGYGARIFDFVSSDQNAMRLLAWGRLERPQYLDDLKRVDPRLAALKNAQGNQEISASFSPELLLSAVLALATCSTTLNPLCIPDVTKAQSKDATRVGLRRAIEKLCFDL